MKNYKLIVVLAAASTLFWGASQYTNHVLDASKNLAPYIKR